MSNQQNYPFNSATPLGIIDHFITKDNFFYPFTIDDTVLSQLNKQNLPVKQLLHFWPSEPTVFLGGMDMRTPHIDTGLDYLIHDQGLHPVIRPAGGLAVVSDPGILNFTYLVHPEEERLSIDTAYHLLVAALDKIFTTYGYQLTTGEVARSYCPGKFDVSLKGKKIAGIAQRRIGKAVGIYVYISLSGDQKARGQLIKNFYQHAIQGEETTAHYPDITPDCMANVADFIPELADSETFKQALITSLANQQELIEATPFLNANEIEKAQQKMQKRNQPILQKIVS